jgi:hypothetical protein
LKGSRPSERAWARVSEESLLEAVAGERLVKTRQAGKDLAGGGVICELWILAMALYRNMEEQPLIFLNPVPAWNYFRLLAPAVFVWGNVYEIQPRA